MAKFRLVTLNALEIRDWVVQTSVLNNKTICIVLFNVVTFRCIVRYFTDEMQAHLFFSDVVNGERDVPENE